MSYGAPPSLPPPRVSGYDGIELVALWTSSATPIPIQVPAFHCCVLAKSALPRVGGGSDGDEEVEPRLGAHRCWQAASLCPLSLSLASTVLCCFACYKLQDTSFFVVWTRRVPVGVWA